MRMGITTRNPKMNKASKGAKVRTGKAHPLSIRVRATGSQCLRCSIGTSGPPGSPRFNIPDGDDTYGDVPWPDSAPCRASSSANTRPKTWKPLYMAGAPA